MPLADGERPVATALHTGSAWVGFSVARCSTAPASNRRPKFGSRPSATAGEITSSVAPSSASTMTREERTGSTPTAGGAGGGISALSRARPRAVSEAASEMAIIAISSTALTRPPRRPRCASAMSRKTTADAESVIAPAVMRVTVGGSSTAVKLRRFSHMIVALPPAAMTHSHDSTRTLSHPGESRSPAVSWRRTMSA